MEGYAIFDRTGFVIYQHKDALSRFFSLGECFREYSAGEWAHTGCIGIVNLDTNRIVTVRGH